MLKSLVSYIKDDGSIMFFGDTAQQIYGNKISWKSAGLRVRKVYTLDENHRNTVQIQNLADALRKNMGLTDENDTGVTNALSDGELPSVARFDDRFSELEFIADKSEELSLNGNVAVLFKTNRDVQRFCGKLTRRNTPCIIINRDTKAFKDLKGIFVGTYFAIKGLEFDSIIISHCNDDYFIDDSRILALESEEEVDVEVAKLLYVAMTRAKKTLVITHTDDIVRFFPKDNGLYTNSIKGVNG